MNLRENLKEAFMAFEEHVLLRVQQHESISEVSEKSVSDEGKIDELIEDALMKKEWMPAYWRSTYPDYKVLAKLEALCDRIEFAIIHVSGTANRTGFAIGIYDRSNLTSYSENCKIQNGERTEVENEMKKYLTDKVREIIKLVEEGTVGGDEKEE